MNQNDEILAKVTAVRDDLANVLIDRAGAIDGALLALLTGEHLLLLGAPGTAKSMLVRSLCERIDGARYFERLLTRFSTPEELFGPLSLPALEQGRYERITDGTLVDAHIAFLDEIFKSNSSILNSLLAIVHERLFHESGMRYSVPLRSLFAASNETPDERGLNALYDRFLIRVVVPYLADDESMRSLLSHEPSAAAATLSLDDITTAQSLVRGTPLTEQAVEAVIAIKHALEEEGVAASDRRWKACGDLLRARAWLEGEQETMVDHCDVLVHALWTEPSQIRLVERVIGRIANPLSLEAVELEDAAQDLYDQRPAPGHPDLTQALEPLLRQLADIHTRLEQRIATSPARRSHRARRALTNVEAQHRALSQLALRSLSKLHMAPGSA
jgi:MoxR-like ATPase